MFFDKLANGLTRLGRDYVQSLQEVIEANTKPITLMELLQHNSLLAIHEIINDESIAVIFADGCFAEIKSTVSYDEASTPEITFFDIHKLDQKTQRLIESILL